ncbi:MAG: hypothetical protein HY675_14665 [Chloroflexi bacterium]|nr:hypothetical protein [Chloroflexota bacterium]
MIDASVFGVKRYRWCAIILAMVVGLLTFSSSVAAGLPVQPFESLLDATRGSGGTSAQDELSVNAPRLPEDATDCGTDINCLIGASQGGVPAKLTFVVPALEIFGLTLSTTSLLAVEGADGDRIFFYQETIEAEVTVSDEAIAAMRGMGMPEANINAMIDSANADAQRTVGTGKRCEFAEPDLTAMLQRWKEGEFSSSDWDSGTCMEF